MLKRPGNLRAHTARKTFSGYIIRLIFRKIEDSFVVGFETIRKPRGRISW